MPQLPASMSHKQVSSRQCCTVLQEAASTPSLPAGAQPEPEASGKQHPPRTEVGGPIPLPLFKRRHQGLINSSFSLLRPEELQECALGLVRPFPEKAQKAQIASVPSASQSEAQPNLPEPKHFPLAGGSLELSLPASVRPCSAEAPTRVGRLWCPGAHALVFPVLNIETIAVPTASGILLGGSQGGSWFIQHV